MDTPSRKPLLDQGDITVIPIRGTLVRYVMGLEAASGRTSYQEIGELLSPSLALYPRHAFPVE